MNNTPTVFTEGEFRKATASQPGKECVQVARRDGRVEIRDDKTTFGAPDDHRLVLTEDQFDGFLSHVRSGEIFGHCLDMTRRPHDSYIFRVANDPSSTQLHFTAAEVAAFLDGINNREFDRLAYASTAGF